MANADQERALSHVERLAAGDYRALERAVAQKRSAWLEQRGFPKRAAWSPNDGPVSPRQAFELFFFEYLGLDPEQLPVVEENEARLTWLSKNACSTLAACSQ